MMFMEPPITQHHDMLMGAAASSQHSCLENMLVCSPKNARLQQQEEEEEEQKNNNNGNGNVGKGTTVNNKPQTEQALKCPRCESTNTKFCYYNNYSLSQPRYFCKSCKRYWTQGGTLRNVPVGGGCRKNHKRPSSSISSKRPTNLSHVDPQFSVEAASIPPFINGFPMDLSLCHFGANNGMAVFPPQNQKSFNHPDQDFSFLGTLGLHGMFGNTDTSPENIHAGFLDTIRSGLFNESQHNKSSFQHFYGETPGLCEDMGSVPKREMVTPDHHTEGENLVLWGSPWNGNINSKVADLARPGSSWNGINSAATNWQGIMNSPLM